MDEPPFIGDWHFVKKLGSGGFGYVKLWENRKTGQKIAIKKCQANLSQDQSSLQKLKERWNREIQYMTHEIKNENIVQGLLVKPDSFLTELNKSNQLPMPALVMEYCEGGDLRSALTEHNNTSGLVESEVCSVLKCLLSAISYLHGIKISHRDIKPENCVIKTNQHGEKVYKLTDLGYARAIDRQSLVASLVGTIEYVAPELLITDKYSNSVDYWSFGIIAFEIITGVRPFVPHMPLVQWIMNVKQKKSENIYVTENNEGICYGSTLFPENQISSCLKSHMENWLKLALEWNPKHRGHVFETSKSKSVSFADMSNSLPPIPILKIFTMLDDILNRKILTVFCLYTYQSYSYEIDATTTMNDFLDSIEKSTSIPKEKIRLTIPVYNHQLEKIDENTKPIDLFFDKYFAISSNSLPRIPILKIFTMLDDILNRKILTVFCLYTYQSYSYEIDATTTMNDFLDSIEKSTSIPKEKIRLTIPVDNHQLEKIDENTKPIDLFFDKYFDKPMLFAGYSGMLMKTDNFIEIPELVKLVMADFKIKLKPHLLKRFVYNVLYFIRNEQKKYVTALDGFYNYSLQLNHHIELYDLNINKMIKTTYGLNGAVKLLDRMLSTLKRKEEKYLQLNEKGFKLREQCQKLQINIGILAGACDKIVKRFRSVHRRSREFLGNSLLDKGFQTQDYFHITELSKKYEIMREQFASKIFTDGQQLDIFKCAYNCLKRRDQLLRDEPFVEFQRQTVNVSIEMEEIKKTVKNAILQGEKYESELNKINDDIIEFIQSQQYQSINGSDFIPDIERILVQNTSIEPEFHIGQPVTPSWNMNGNSIHFVPLSTINGNDTVDAISICEDNEHLRQRIADVINVIDREFTTSTKAD